ncbi:MAG: penicillin-binding transpeptidase domain-containing protein [Nitratireductor sp.]
MRRAGNRTGKIAVAVLAVIAAPLMVVYFLSGELAEIDVWKKEVTVVRASQDSEALLKSMYQAQLVQFDHNKPEFSHDPCEALVDDGVAHHGNLGDGSVRALLSEFCGSTGGKAIKTEIADWNASFGILAVRDNGERSANCADDNRETGRVLTLGCRPSRWQVVRAADANGRTAAVQTVRRFPPHRAFGHIARRGGVQFSDWLMVSNSEAVPDPDAVADFVLSNTLSGNDEAILIDLIGEPTAMVIGKDRLVIGEQLSSGNERDFRLGGVNGSIILLCGKSGPEGGQPSCATAPGLGEAHSWRIRIGKLAKNAKIDIAITARFSQNLPDDLLAFNKAVGEGKDAAPVKLKRSDHLGITCRLQGQGNVVCEPEWSISEQLEQLERKRYRLLLSDKRELIDADGRTTNLTFDLGLAALVGFSPRDNGSLSAGLARLKLDEDTDYTLTINPEIQAAALKSIVAAVEKNAPTAFRRANARGAMVLLDAGDDEATRGDVLAVASVPLFHPGLNEWDLVALAEAGGAVNPLAGHAWRQSDVHATPGSSFKTISGLAGIEAAANDISLQEVILGSISPDEAKRRLGGTGDRIVVQDRGIKDFTISGAFAKAVKDPAKSHCPDASPVQTQMSVCEALIVSSNPWFAGLNLTVDGAVANRKDAGTTSNLAKVVGSMFPVLTPADKGQAGCNQCLDLTWGAIPSARTQLEAIDIPMVSNPIAGRIDIALNSFGQGVRAAPMAMTSLYASIASGHVVIPRIVRGGDKPGFENIGKPVPSEDTEFSRAGIEALKAGLKGVVESEGGTARRVDFRQHKGRIFAKTGTADTGDGVATRRGLPNSVSFTGWVEPGANIKQRLAFTCWMTHLPKGEFGGSVCAPLVSDVLNSIPADSQ